MPQTASAVRGQSPVLCRHWRLDGLFDHLRCWSNILQHGWLDPLGLCATPKLHAAMAIMPILVVRLSASSLWVVCTFASSPDIFLGSPVWVMVASMLYTQLAIAWARVLCHSINAAMSMPFPHPVCLNEHITPLSIVDTSLWCSDCCPWQNLSRISGPSQSWSARSRGHSECSYTCLQQTCRPP